MGKRWDLHNFTHKDQEHGKAEREYSAVPLIFHVGTHILKYFPSYPTAALNASSPCEHLWQARQQQTWGSQMFTKVGKNHPQKAAPNTGALTNQKDSRDSIHVKQT